MSDQPTPTSPDEMENCLRPNMMPRQWDLSEMMSAPVRNEHHQEPFADVLYPEEIAGETAEPTLFDPCPETNTMPAGWDLSELY